MFSHHVTIVYHACVASYELAIIATSIEIIKNEEMSRDGGAKSNLNKNCSSS